MKKIHLILLIITSVITINPGTVTAQKGQGGGYGRQQMSAEDIAERQTKWMSDILDLSDEQLAAIKEINMKYADKLVSQRQSARGNREAMRSLMTRLTKEKDEELKKVLTEEQFALLQKKRQEFMKNRQGGGRGQGY